MLLEYCSFLRDDLTLIKVFPQCLSDNFKKSHLEKLMPIEQFNLNSIFDCEHPAARFAVDGALQFELCRSLLDLAEHLPGRLDREAIAYSPERFFLRPGRRM